MCWLPPIRFGRPLSEFHDKFLDQMARARGLSGRHRRILVRQAAVELAALRSQRGNLRTAPARLCRRASAQAQATGNFGTLRLHSKPFVFGKRASRHWIFGGQPLMDFRSVARCVPRDFLSRCDSPRAGRTQKALRRRVRKLRLASTRVLAAAHACCGIDRTFLLAALPPESRIRGGHWPCRSDGYSLVAHALAQVRGFLDHVAQPLLAVRVCKYSLYRFGPNI